LLFADSAISFDPTTVLRVFRENRKQPVTVLRFRHSIPNRSEILTRPRRAAHDALFVTDRKSMDRKRYTRDDDVTLPDARTVAKNAVELPKHASNVQATGVFTRVARGIPLRRTARARLVLTSEPYLNRILKTTETTIGVYVVPLAGRRTPLISRDRRRRFCTITHIH